MRKVVKRWKEKVDMCFSHPFSQILTHMYMHKLTVCIPEAGMMVFRVIVAGQVQDLPLQT